ncbi:MAG: PstA family ABC transporter permease [Planctomycetota bacterium]
MSTIQSPDFSNFETSSTASRQWMDKLFYLVCIGVATLSVVILGVLLTTIFLAAIPAFGPHTDHFESTHRMAVVQGTNKGNDPELVDQGDFIQGIFLVNEFVGGGLGETNDTSGEKGKTQLGVYCFEVVETISQSDVDVLLRLKAASASHAITHILDEVGIDCERVDGQAAIALLSANSKTETTEIGDFEFNDVLDQDGKIASVVTGESNEWNIDLLLGQRESNELIELKFQASSSDEDRPAMNSLTSIKKFRNNKKAGQLNCILSILGGNEASKVKPVRIRSFETSELVSGEIKIDSEYLKGLSRRKKKGFLLGGDLNLSYCPVPEKDASSLSHVAQFVTGIPKTIPSEAGIGPAMAGSLWVITFCAIFALPIGVATAIFLEEFKPTNKFLLFLHGLIQLNISNLAGVPSIVYGILGLTAFATMFGFFGNNNEPAFQIGAAHYFQYLTEGGEHIVIPVSSPAEPPILEDGIVAEGHNGESVEIKILGPDDAYPEDQETLARSLYHDAEGGPIQRNSWYYLQLPFGRGVLAASLTLMLVILPVIIISTQEALKAVPSSLREGALGLGSTPWQVVRKVTLPAAIPSIMTGAILSMSRAIGEAAPILILCGIVFITAGPQHLMDEYSVLPIQIYYWTKEPIDRVDLINYQNIAAAGIVVLLAILLTFNAIAILIRQLTQKPLS